MYGQDQAVAEWVAQRLGIPIQPPYRAIGVENEQGEAIGGMVFNDWTGANVEITIFGPGALTRKTLRVALRYVFGELKALRLTARTKRDNGMMQAVLGRLGFEREGVMRDYYGRGQHAVLYRLLPRQAAKWM